MIKNYLVAPHPLLQSMVHYYMLNTSNEEKITFSSLWPASNETSLIFYLRDKPKHSINNITPSPLQSCSGSLIGLQSQCNGKIYFDGVYHTFIIQFKENGYNKIFSAPATEMLNQIFSAEDVFGSAASILNERLKNANDLQDMAVLADQFLFCLLNRRNKTSQIHEGISDVLNQLFVGSLLSSVEHYAHKANMSVRNFSRRFTEQVGVSPKFYCRLVRFNNAINTKIKNSNHSWTSISYQCGYFDQMHLIRDFFHFTNATPSDLFNAANGASRPRMVIHLGNNYYFKDLNRNLENESFINITRKFS